MSYLFLFYLILLSIVAFLAYGIDKRRAKRRAWRVPEAFLLAVGFFGGAAGALGAMQLFRHKTKHWYFYAFNLIGLVWQLACLVFLFVK